MLNITTNQYTLIVANLLLIHYGMDVLDVDLDESMVEASIAVDERPYELVNNFVNRYDLERITPSAHPNIDNTLSTTDEEAAIRLLNLSVELLGGRMALAFCRDASESLFDSIYQQLQSKSAMENQSLYDAEIRKCKTQRQRNEKSGYYAGRWQKLFNLWVENKIENTFVLSCLSSNVVPESIIA